MGEFDAYLSDGEGPTRVYPMYQDEDGEWQVTTVYIDLDFVDAWSGEPVGPSVWDERFNEIKKYYTTVIGQQIKKSANYRYYLKVEFPAGSLTDRGDVVALANASPNQRFRVYPHNDCTLIYFDCTISDINVTSRHHVEGIRYPDYAPYVEFTGVNIVKIIPHNYSTYHYFFIDKTQWGAYTAAEKQRALTMRDKTNWAAYTSSDYEGYFTRKSLEQSPGG